MKTLGISGVLKVCGICVVGTSAVIGGIFFSVSPDVGKSNAAYQTEAHYYADARMPVYPGSVEYPVGEDLRVNETPIQLTYYYTDDNPSKVSQFYMDSFRVKGLDPQERWVSENEVNVYALEENGESQYNISIISENGRTIVFPLKAAVSNSYMASDGLKNSKDIPFSENAVGLMKVDAASEDGGVISYFEPKFDMLTGVGYIRDSLGKRNWSIVNYTTEIKGKDLAMIEVRKGIKLMKFNISKAIGRQGIAVVVSVQNIRE